MSKEKPTQDWSYRQADPVLSFCWFIFDQCSYQTAALPLLATGHGPAPWGHAARLLCTDATPLVAHLPGFVLSQIHVPNARKEVTSIWGWGATAAVRLVSRDLTQTHCLAGSARVVHRLEIPPCSPRDSLLASPSLGVSGASESAGS